MHCILVKIYTNQGLVGMGEIRDGSSATYAAMLKSRLLGENPCDVDRLFRKIKQFGGQSRQGGGVSGLEIALWDLAGQGLRHSGLSDAGRQVPRLRADVLRSGQNAARHA